MFVFFSLHSFLGGDVSSFCFALNRPKKSPFLCPNGGGIRVWACIEILRHYNYIHTVALQEVSGHGSKVPDIALASGFKLGPDSREK